ncbi:hypothetical protein C8R44DRAFT_236931 [Mycena epipterygia]|nr:hypothetical protein C8R44DRAFT_236931 [Mycena epipterygia]
MLHTNAAPTDIECDAIRDFVAGPRKEAASLTKEIARMQALIEKLVQKRDELNESIDAHLALVSPARRLPSDVVQGIFCRIYAYRKLYHDRGRIAASLMPNL